MVIADGVLVLDVSYLEKTRVLEVGDHVLPLSWLVSVAPRPLQSVEREDVGLEALGICEPEGVRHVVIGAFTVDSEYMIDYVGVD